MGFLCLFLLFLTMILAGKIYLIKKSADEIREQFVEKLDMDTNTLIVISGRDKHMRLLAECLNEELRRFVKERHRFCQGDRELKEAVTNISHDLRTPLTAVCGYLDLLKKEEVTESARGYLSMIENRTEAMKQMTEELFRYSVIVSAEELSREWVCVNHVLEECLAGFYGAIQKKQIKPEVFLPEKKVERYLDSPALMRIFGNIVGNALKYSAGDFEVVMEEDGKISFSNTAPELDAVELGRLFDRFYTVEAGRNSTGLGLSIAKTLTERMGGTIGAEYAAGRLSVWVWFPENQ